MSIPGPRSNFSLDMKGSVDHKLRSTMLIQYPGTLVDMQMITCSQVTLLPSEQCYGQTVEKLR